jgi:hypothetical protein
MLGDIVSWTSQWVGSFLGALSPAQWDAWRNWLATIGGIIALLVAIRTYRRNVQLKNEEQARKVYAEVQAVANREPGTVVQGDTSIQLHHEVGTWEKVTEEAWRFTTTKPWRSYRYEVTNGSDEIIGPLTFMEQHAYQDGQHRGFSKREMVLKPGASIQIQSIFPGSNEDLPASLFIITFRDSAGRWWSREGTEPVRAVREPGAPRIWHLRIHWRSWKTRRAFAKNRQKESLRNGRLWPSP